MSGNRSIVEGLVFVMLLIPIGLWYVFKWTVMGIAVLVKLCIFAVQSLFSHIGTSKTKANSGVIQQSSTVDNAEHTTPVLANKNAKGTSIIVGSGKATKKAPTQLEPNQLTANVYIIGKDIPPGVYDFTLVYGNGYLLKSTEETATMGVINCFQWLGTKHDYEYEQCIGVVCKEGERLNISGNIVVQIKKAQSVQIDL